MLPYWLYCCCTPTVLAAKTIGKYNGTRIIISHMELAKSLPGFGNELQS